MFTVCLRLQFAWYAAVGVWYIQPSMAGFAAGCVCFPKLPGCECINVIHWQHERQRNYSWRCRPVCHNSGICQLSELFISHLSLKLFVGLSVNGGLLPVEWAELKCRLLEADALNNNLGQTQMADSCYPSLIWQWIFWEYFFSYFLIMACNTQMFHEINS